MLQWQQMQRMCHWPGRKKVLPDGQKWGSMSTCLRSGAVEDLRNGSLANVELGRSFPLALSTMPITHSLAHWQRSKNGQSPGWKSCRVGLGKDSRYARSNGGFERCVYKYTRIHVYTCLRIIRVWCGSMGSSAVCRRCRETLAGICCSILSCASAVDLPTAVLPGVLHRRRCVVLFSNLHWWNSSSVLLEDERWMPIAVLQERTLWECGIGWGEGANQKTWDVQLEPILVWTRK